MTEPSADPRQPTLLAAALGGLCPRCGANLNEGPCDCPTIQDETEEVSVWKAAIKGLKLDPDQ